MCLNFAQRTSQVADAKNFVVSWDDCLEKVLQQRSKAADAFNVLEMQRICLFFSECSSQSAALSIVEEDIRAKWSMVLPIVAANSSSSISWTIMRAVIDVEMKSKDICLSSLLSLKKAVNNKASKNSRADESEIQLNWRCSLDSLIAQIRMEGLVGVQSIDLELLSRVACLAVEVDVAEAAKHYTCRDNMSQYESLSDLLLDALQSFCQTLSVPAGDKLPEDMSKYVSCLSRTYITSLGWFQKYFQCRKTEKEDNSLCVVESNMSSSPDIIAVRIVKCILQSLGECCMWMGYSPALLGVLRAVGNCLSQLPLHCFKESESMTTDSTLSLSMMLSECVCAVLGGLQQRALDGSKTNSNTSNNGSSVGDEHCQDIISTCIMLGSLVGGKYLGKKLFVSCAHVSASVIHSVYTYAFASSLDLSTVLSLNLHDSTLNSTDNGNSSKHAISTADTGAINRVLLNLSAACVLGFFDTAAAAAARDSVIKSACVRVDKDNNNCTSESGATSLDGMNTHDDSSDSDSDDDVYCALMQSCRPVLETVYAEDFLYAVCSDILTRICSTRPAQVLAAGTGTSRDATPALFYDATRFISNLLGLASGQNVHTVHTKNGISVVLLYCQSHMLWGGLSVTPGASDELSSRVIKALKELGQDIDSNSMDNVAVVKGVSRHKRVIKAERTLDPSMSPPLDLAIRISAEHLRTWILLAQWGLPLSANKVRTTLTALHCIVFTDCILHLTQIFLFSYSPCFFLPFNCSGGCLRV